MSVDLGAAPIERITCLYTGRIGDVIVATPFLRALRKQFLNWRAMTAPERTEMFAESERLLTSVAAAEEIQP